MGKKIGGAILILLFVLPFGAVGGIAAWGIAHMLRKSYEASDWVLVQAKVWSAQLVTHRGKKSTSYEALATYHYQVNGKRYESSQLGFGMAGRSENVDDDEALAAFLIDAKETGKPITVFVNPDNPAEAVVERGVRWGMIGIMSIFAIVFGGVGVGGLFAAVYSLFGGGSSRGGSKDVKSIEAYVAARNAAAAPDSQAAGPFAPNLARIDPEGHGSMALGWILTILWNAIAWPVAYFVTLQVIVARGEYLAAFVYLLPLVGLVLLWGVASTTVSKAGRGKSALVLQTLRPAMGGKLAGAIAFEKRRRAGMPFELELGAFDVKGRNEGSPSVIPRWSGKKPVRLSDDPRGGSRADFTFDVPPRVDHGPLGTEWRILLKNPGAFGVLETYPLSIASPRAAEDDTFAAKRDPNVGAHERATAALFGAQAAAKMTPAQQAALANLSPEARSLAVNLHKHGKTIRNVVIGVFVLIVASQVVPGILYMLRSD